jgi:hypothetical protein
MNLTKQEKEIMIDVIEGEITILSMCSPLCNISNEDIVAKYDLHGTIDDAINKLKEIQQLIIDNKYTTKMFDDVTIRLDRYYQSLENDPYVKELNAAHKLGDNRKVFIMIQRRDFRLIEMHNKKECVCYY